MKTPRVRDFDPDAKVPTLKSSLDNMPSIDKPRPVNQNKTVAQSPSPLPTSNLQQPKSTIKTNQSDKTPNTVIRDVRPVLPVPPKRIMKQRWPVDIYHDQYESLQRLALEDRMQGGVGSMSAMVREALDRLIKEKQESKK
jgi:hypothetical protein